MATSDPADVLLKHNQWANQRVLEACRGLGPEQLEQRFEMGLGTVRATWLHTIGAMRGWKDLLANREGRPRLTAGGQSVEELERLAEEAATDLSTHAKGGPMDEVLSREWGGKRYSFTRGAVIAHVTTHGMHHRAQLLNMLRHLGVTPLPPSSVMEWTMQGDA